MCQPLLRLLCLLVAAVQLVSAVRFKRGTDKPIRHIRSADLLCNAYIDVFFGHPPGPTLASACGEEIPQSLTQRAPTLRLQKTEGSRYSIFIVDRDAPTASMATSAPYLHLGLVNVPGAMLEHNITWLDMAGLASASPDTTGWKAPSPPMNSGCHRYYVLAYRQTKPQALQLQIQSRERFDVEDYAKANGLAHHATSYWVTKHKLDRVSCAA